MNIHLVVLLALGLFTGVAHAQEQIPPLPQTPAMAEAQKATTQAQSMFQQQRFAEAQVQMERVLALYEKEPGLDPLYITSALDYLAALHAYQQHGALAELLLVRSLEIRTQRLGEHHPHVVTSLQSLVTMHVNSGAPDKALRYIRRAVAAQEAITGKNSKELVPLLDQWAGVHEAMGQEREAQTVRGRMLEVVEAVHGPKSFETAQMLNLLGMSFKQSGDYASADGLFQRALSIAEALRGPDDVNVGALLNNVADNLREKGEYAKAEALLRRALAIHLKNPGEGSEEVATDTANLGLVLYKQGKDVEAEKLLRQAIAVRQKVNPKDPNLSYPLNNLAELLRTHARFAEARALYQQALDLRAVSPGTKHPLYATALQNLGLLELEVGETAKARKRMEQALEIYVGSLGPDHPLVSNLLRNFGSSYVSRDLPQEGAQVLEQALLRDEKVLGKDHPTVGYSCNQLGLAYHAMGQQDKAEASFKRALDILSKQLGAHHADVAMVQANLAECLRVKGQIPQATRLLQQAMKSMTKAYGPEHPKVATCHNNLGLLALAAGDLKTAEKELQHALVLRRKIFGDHHPMVLQSISNMIDLWILKGKVPRALDLVPALLDGWERHLPVAMATATEREQLQIAQSLLSEMNRVVALHIQHASKDPRANAMALRAVLILKGRVLDEMALNRQALRERASPEVAKLLERENQLRTRCATLVLQGPGAAGAQAYQAELLAVEQEMETNSAALAQASGEYRAHYASVTVQAVKARLPPNAALLEVVVWRPAEVKRQGKADWGAQRYAVYLLRGDGTIHVMDLGPELELDASIKALHQALSDPEVPGVDALSKDLHARTLQRVEPWLANVDTLLVAPSMELNSIPWGVLKDESGRYLLDRMDVVYLGSGRDLLRMAEPRPMGQEPQVFANPDFGTEGGKNLALRGQSYLRGVQFSPLPGTHQEATALKSVLQQVKVMEGAAVTESQLKGVKMPSILHVATHGFFLDLHGAPAVGTRGLKLVKEDGATNPPVIENPLLRSGLALAGANRTQEGTEDGILTALEVGGMNLWGTQLVVLSACQSAVGSATAEGNMGLRRALVIAGAQTQVMSLWSVDDDATKELMVSFYKGLTQGMGRSQALRQAQQTMARSSTHGHPFYWAAFIVSGDWKPMPK